MRPPLVKFVMLLFFVSVFFGILNTPFYRFKKLIVVSDDSRVENVIETLLPKGMSFLFFPYRSARNAILEAEPSISSVKYGFDLSAGLALEVIPLERQPVALVNDGFHSLFMDDKGIVFPREKVVPDLFPVKLPPNVHLIPGAKIPSPWREFLLSSLPVFNSFPVLRSSNLVLDSKGDWLVFTKDGICVKAGGATDLKKRLAILPPILRVVRSKRLSVDYIDVRLENMPAIKLKNKSKARNGS